jgi:hypothetical protein
LYFKEKCNLLACKVYLGSMLCYADALPTAMLSIHRNANSIYTSHSFIQFIHFNSQPIILLLRLLSNRLSRLAHAQESRRHTPRCVRSLSHICAHQLAPFIVSSLQPLDLLVRVRVAVREARRRISVLGGVARYGADFVGAL